MSPGFGVSVGVSLDETKALKSSGVPTLVRLRMSKSTSKLSKVMLNGTSMSSLKNVPGEKES